jgi:hypothetical protein
MYKIATPKARKKTEKEKQNMQKEKKKPKKEINNYNFIKFSTKTL